ncbi:hypothetical protein CAJAP_10637 [Camponotus japonicus]
MRPTVPRTVETRESALAYLLRQFTLVVVASASASETSRGFADSRSDSERIASESFITKDSITASILVAPQTPVIIIEKIPHRGKILLVR